MYSWKQQKKKPCHLLSLFGSETSGRESQKSENQNMIFMLSVENKILPKDNSLSLTH